MLVSSARGFLGACCCTEKSIIVVVRFKLVNTRKRWFLCCFGCLALALVLKNSLHQVVMFHIECQFTGSFRPRQKMSAYLGM